MSTPTRFTLTQADIPTHWYNVLSDVPEPLPPPLHPGTKQPVTLQDMTAIFPENLVAQEMTTERWVEIPEPVREIYAMWRPTPLLRAVRLGEGAANAGAHLFQVRRRQSRREPQAEHGGAAGVLQQDRRHETTGHGDGRGAVGFVAGDGVQVVWAGMPRVHGQGQLPPETVSAAADAHVGRDGPRQPERLHGVRQEIAQGRSRIVPGSLGIAISEAIEDTVKHPGTKYSLGSVLNHVCMHQTVIGQEAIKQMVQAGEEPDVVIGCVGGGSNFAGIAFPFVRGKIVDKKKTRIIAVEPSVCATLTKGELRYDFGDTAMTTPLLWMYTLGHDFIPPQIHAGGLRYHGMAPTVSHLQKLGLIDAVAYEQSKVFEAAVLFAQNEGIVPAPESAHAIRAAIDEAIEAREEGKKRVILFNLSGHGMLDLASYEAYFAGKLHDG